MSPPPMATPVWFRVVLVLPLARPPLIRLIRNRRPLALLEIIPQLCLRNILITVPVPPVIRRRQAPNLGLTVLPRVIVPLVTMRTNGLFRLLGKMVEPSPPHSLLSLFPVRTRLLCGFVRAPRAAAAIMRVRGIGPGQMLVVIRFVMRVTLMNRQVLTSLVTLCTPV